MKYDSIYNAIDDHSQILFSVFPNPADKIVSISLLNGKNEKTDLEIADVNGRNYLRMAVSENTISLDVRYYPAGVYIITLMTSKAVVTRKFLKR